MSNTSIDCPDCEGSGIVEVEYAVPHNINIDVGYIDTRMEECEDCFGSGQVEREDEDDE